MAVRTLNAFLPRYALCLTPSHPAGLLQPGGCPPGLWTLRATFAVLLLRCSSQAVRQVPPLHSGTQTSAHRLQKHYPLFITLTPYLAFSLQSPITYIHTHVLCLFPPLNISSKCVKTLSFFLTITTVPTTQ